MSQYFPKLYKIFEGNINVKVDLSNYAIKSDIKNISHVDTSSFTIITNLASLKSEVDILDIGIVAVDLTKLSNVAKNNVAKKTVHDKLVEKVNNIDNSGFILKTKYDADKSELEWKFLILVKLLKKKKNYNTKISSFA